LGTDYGDGLLNEYLDQPLPSLAAVRAKCVLALEFDARPWLNEILCPALVVAGDRDPVVPPTYQRWALAKNLTSGRFHLLPGGHLVHIVRAAEVGRLVDSWLPGSPGLAGAA
jgi:pimeloyl-ACP methyl ester carboxylesterase